MPEEKHRICPVQRAGTLDSRLRRILQNPFKILSPYIKEGMSVLDIGCGTGFFSMEMAQIVGESGHVIAADLQEGMLKKLEKKIRGTELEKRIRLHQCKKDSISLKEKVDFALAFYMVHEIEDKKAFFNEASSILKPEGQLLIVEPPFHVSKKEFERTTMTARKSGLKVHLRPDILFSKAALMVSSEN